MGLGEGAGIFRLSSGPVLPSGAGCAAESVFPVGAAPTSPRWFCRKGLSHVFSMQLKTIPRVRVCVRLHIHSCRSVSSSGRRVVGLGERVVLEDLNTLNLWTSSCGLKKRSNQPALCVAWWVTDTAICEQTWGVWGCTSPGPGAVVLRTALPNEQRVQRLVCFAAAACDVVGVRACFALKKPAFSRPFSAVGMRGVTRVPVVSLFQPGRPASRSLSAITFQTPAAASSCW